MLSVSPAITFALKQHIEPALDAVEIVGYHYPLRSIPVIRGFVLLLVLTIVGCSSDSSSSRRAEVKADYDETATINACSHSSGSCYSLDADLTHHFSDNGKEIAYVDRIHFPNGGYLEFDDGTVPGEGTDKKGNDWSFSF